MQLRFATRGVLVTLTLLLSVFGTASVPASGAVAPAAPASGAAVTNDGPTAQVTIPGSAIQARGPLNDVGVWIAAIYRFGIGIAGILALLMMMGGGLLWLTSAGSPTRAGVGKEWIISALTGFIIALFSYLMLYTINPQIVTSDPAMLQPLTGRGTANLGYSRCCWSGSSYVVENGDSETMCSDGTTGVSLDFCYGKPNQQCNPPDQLTNTDQDCSTACATKGGMRSWVRLINPDGSFTLQGCCVCSGSSNGQCGAFKAECGGNLPPCCAGLVCQTWGSVGFLGDDPNCLAPQNTYAPCDRGPDCRSGLCDTSRLPRNECAPIGGWPDGEKCGGDRFCASGMCNKNGPLLNKNRCAQNLVPDAWCDRPQICASRICERGHCL